MGKLILTFFAAMIALSALMFTVPRDYVTTNEQAILLLFLGGSKGRGAEVASNMTKAPSEVEVASLKKWLIWGIIL